MNLRLDLDDRLISVTYAGKFNGKKLYFWNSLMVSEGEYPEHESKLVEFEMLYDLLPDLKIENIL